MACGRRQYAAAAAAAAGAEPSAAGRRLKREYDAELAARPKKPPAKGNISGWTLFVRENYSRVAGDHPTVPPRGIFGEVRAGARAFLVPEVSDRAVLQPVCAW